MNENYDDIINHPHHTSAVHPRMSMLNRAAQFAPFAALTGYDAAIRESARLTDSQVELSDYDNDQLNRKMASLKERIHERPVVEILYFQPDDHKAGGAYQTVNGQLKTIDETAQSISLTNGLTIPLSRVIDLKLGTS